MWRQREICPLIAANHSALAEFLRFLRNIPPFRWLNSAKIKKLRNANTTNKDYSGARRCIMPNSFATLKKSKTLDGPLKKSRKPQVKFLCDLLTFWEKIQLFHQKIQLFQKKVAFLRPLIFQKLRKQQLIPYFFSKKDLLFSK